MRPGRWEKVVSEPEFLSAYGVAMVGGGHVLINLDQEEYMLVLFASFMNE